MKAKLERLPWSGYKVVIQQGTQFFTLNPVELPKSEAQWFAKMFRLALKNHDNEQKQRHAR